MNLRNLLSLPRDIHSSFSFPLHSKDRWNEIVDTFLLSKPFSSGNVPTHFPAINISETNNTILIKAELPSIDDKSVNIDVYQNRLTISGEKKEETSEEKDTYHVCEIAYGKFSRSLTLPFDIDVNNIKANFNKGVLTISVQKPEIEMNQSQRIPITADNQ